MSEQISSLDESDAVPSGKQNRLSIAHLLLWMATTGGVIARLQADKPPPAEKIGFGSFLHQARTEEEWQALFKKRQQERWRGLQASYVVRLFFAPVPAAALAGGLLAAWRIVTRRFGFPVQPGHWLLVGIAAMLLLASFRSIVILQASGDAADILAAIGATSLLSAITVASREPLRWRVAFGSLAVSFAAAGLGLSLAPGLLDPALMLVLSFPLAVITCAMIDLAE